MINVCMIVYNEQELLDYSLPQAFDLADRLIIINGSPFGPSTDNTKSIIDKYIDSPKVIYEEGTYGSPYQYKNSYDPIMRNAYLKHVPVGEWILQLDADEFYTWEDQERMKAIIRDPTNSNATGLNIGNLHFYIDVFHYLDGVGVDMHYRLVKHLPNSYYSLDRPDAILYHGRYQAVAKAGKFIDAKHLKCFHVGHALPWDDYKKKQSKFFYMGSPFHCWNVKTIEELNALPEQRNYNHELLTEYTGPYPSFMQEAINDKHPFFIRRIKHHD